MVLATVVEERDLVAHFGQQYREYQRNVGRFVPQFVYRAWGSRGQSSAVDGAARSADERPVAAR